MQPSIESSRYRCTDFRQYKSFHRSFHSASLLNRLKLSCILDLLLVDPKAAFHLSIGQRNLQVSLMTIQSFSNQLKLLELDLSQSANQKTKLFLELKTPIRKNLDSLKSCLSK